jgi:predicted glycogen debranching enzyme
MSIHFGREICGTLTSCQEREWLITNGIGGYASGTVAGVLTRCYHGLLVAALNPPLGRTLLLTKLEETVRYGETTYPLQTNRWADGRIEPHGYLQIERFQLEGTTPVWHYACADALLEKRIVMARGSNTTYVRYSLTRATAPLTLTGKALVNYRDHHSCTHVDGWQMSVEALHPQGVRILAFEGATPLYLSLDRGEVRTASQCYCDFDLALERYRGLDDREDHLHAATFEATLHPGESLTFVASTEASPELDSRAILEARRHHERSLLDFWQATLPTDNRQTPDWVSHLVLAADQFIVNRSLPDNPEGKSVIAGYHWFGDWGRDTMISLPGLTLSTGRLDVAREILRTFARYTNKGMLPNRFPDFGEVPEYNTVDATLWYFEAIRAYHAATGDDALLEELFPVLAEIIDWHCRGTRYNIGRDDSDGLLYAGTEGVQLTWMDAIVEGWVVTPRMGKPVEVNALWCNALRIMRVIAQILGKPEGEYEELRLQATQGFQRFWNEAAGYCYDVLDAPQGHETALRPNQIFAVSIPESPLTPEQQRRVVDVCARQLLTSGGLRSLAPDDPQYQGRYGGNRLQRDEAYHQGTVWGWLIGPFVCAHLHVYNNPSQARRFLEPMADHLIAHGTGSLSEIFDGDAPMTPRGCIAQAWTVAEVLRAWGATAVLG